MPDFESRTADPKSKSAVPPLLALGAFFILSTLPFISHPLDSWEWLNHAASRQVAERGVPAVDGSNNYFKLLLNHPPSGAYLMGWSVGLFGDSNAARRVPGVALALGAGLFLFLLAKNFFLRLNPDEADGSVLWALVATALYLTNPAAIQGALYISFNEGTLLPLALTAFLWTDLAQKNMKRRSVLLAFLFALSLWAKITTAIFIPMACLAWITLQTIFYLMRRNSLLPSGGEGNFPHPQLGQSLLKTNAMVWLATFVLGTALFAMTWFLYASWLANRLSLPFMQVFTAPVEYLWVESSRGGLVALGWQHLGSATLTLLRMVVYTGPVLCLLAAVGMAQRGRDIWRTRRLSDTDLGLLLTLGVSTAYLVAQGGSGSFPKYHLAVLPFLCLLAVSTVRDFIAEETILPEKAGPLAARLAAWSAGAFFLSLWAVGDLVYTLNYSLRRADDKTFVLILLALKILATPTLLFFAWRYSRGMRWLLLSAALMGLQVGQTMAMAQGRYFLFHCYGSPLWDFERAVEKVKESVPPGEPVLALPEFAYAAGRPLVPGMLRAFWDDPAVLSGMVARHRPDAIIYSPATHTQRQIEQYNSNPQWNKTVGGYRRISVGDYEILVRQDGAAGFQ